MITDIDSLNDLTDRLELLCDWRDQLALQIRRCELLFDLGLLTQEQQDDLDRRVHLWREAADALAASLEHREAA